VVQLTSVVSFVREIPEIFPCTVVRLPWHRCSPPCLPVARKLCWLTPAAGRCVFHPHCSVRSSLRDLPHVEEVPFAFWTPWHDEYFKNTSDPSFKAHHTHGLGMFGLAVYPEIALKTSSAYVKAKTRVCWECVERQHCYQGLAGHR